MTISVITATIADILKQHDTEMPRFRHFRPGIGPFGEPQLVKIIANKLTSQGLTSRTKRSPDLDITGEIAVEFKIVRPYGDNGKEAENWSVNLLHPYPGNASLLGDAMKLSRMTGYSQKILFVIGYEHKPPKICLDPLIESFEVVIRQVIRIRVSERCEEVRDGLVHPEHHVLRCISWELT